MLSHDRSGTAGAPAVLLLHGWPGDRHDMDAVAALLSDGPDELDVLRPDLRGFGGSRLSPDELPDAASAASQVRALVELLDSAGIGEVVVAGYDVGSLVAQTLAREHPDLVRALVVTPPLPGAGQRVLRPEQVGEYWYQSFHQLALAERLLDGREAAVRDYLEHFWSHWSGSGWLPPAELLDRLAAGYGATGALTSSIGWYRAGSGTLDSAPEERPPAEADRLAVPVHVLWPREDPLFPLEWSDELDRWFAEVELTPVDCGHFVPLEAPRPFADAVLAAVLDAGGARTDGAH